MKPLSVEMACLLYTLASEIDLGQGINVGPEKFDKKNNYRALNTHVLWSK